MPNLTAMTSLVYSLVTRPPTKTTSIWIWSQVSSSSATMLALTKRGTSSHIDLLPLNCFMIWALRQTTQTLPPTTFLSLWTSLPPLQTTYRGPAFQLGWKFQFLVPISGTPIVSRIPIPFLIPKIPVGFFLKFQCLESQKFRIPIPKFGIPVPHKKTDTYSSVDTKVHGRKPSPYKTTGECHRPWLYGGKHISLKAAIR
jgi:hypothetical protein